MEFFNSAVEVLQTLVVALGAGLGVWGAVNLLEGYGSDNPGAKSQGMKYVIPWSSIPKELQEPLHRYVSEAEGKLCGYCKEELCNSESGRMVVELYLGKQDGHGSRILY